MLGAAYCLFANITQEQQVVGKQWFNDVAVRDCQLRCITKPYKDAQNRLLSRGTRLASHIPSSS